MSAGIEGRNRGCKGYSLQQQCGAAGSSVGTSRSQGGEQRVARSEDDGASPVEGSNAEGDDSVASSMEYNDTYGSVAALFSYEARKQGMATALKGGMHQESMPRFGF